MWVICLVGGFRELIGNGTLLGIPVSDVKCLDCYSRFQGLFCWGFYLLCSRKFVSEWKGKSGLKSSKMEVKTDAGLFELFF